MHVNSTRKKLFLNIKKNQLIKKKLILSIKHSIKFYLKESEKTTCDYSNSKMNDECGWKIGENNGNAFLKFNDCYLN